MTVARCDVKTWPSRTLHRVLRFVICGLLAANCSTAPIQTLAPARDAPSSPPFSTRSAVRTPTPAAVTPSVATSPTPPPPEATPRLTPQLTPRPTPSIAFADGTHVIGEDIEPGTYRTVDYTDNCYWVRFAGFDNGLQDWIASVIGPGYHVVTIGPEDAGFDSDGCGGWTADLAPVTTADTGIGEGTYIVRVDMAPGRWQASSGANCYWARLSGFGGTDAEVIEQDLAADAIAPVVTIGETDAGFTSNGCGEWRVATP